ncbi:hypothetical protein FACS189416_2090 [Bacteroidia bacterium]|nr:hypothetical protein FACS189416_2090 [Bacteroidia bacterium]
MNIYITKDKPYLDFIKIKSNDVVVIKPNLVKESKETDKNEWRSVITSAFVIKSVAEYVCKQLAGTGKIYICDAPQTDSSFCKIAKKLGLYDVANELSTQYNTPIEVVDLRNEEWTNEKGIIVKREKLSGDPNGAIAFNLGVDSLFYKFKGEGKYYGADYDYKELNRHHTGETQEYLICATPIMADVFISLPKLKTHKKTGVTLSVKNLVGINADKNWLPHHTFGSPLSGGDEYPDISLKRKIETMGSKIMKKIALNVPIFGTYFARSLRNKGMKVFGSGNNTIRSGNWYGNDTTWRMALDLNRCLLYGNLDGSLRKEKPKRYYSIIDGEIGMEGSGPMQGDPKDCGIFISGADPVSVDAVAATVMGFDWEKLPVIREAFYLTTYPGSLVDPKTIHVISEVYDWTGSLEDLKDKQHFDFKAHFGWKGHIELLNNQYNKNVNP